MIPRYSRPEMAAIWAPETRFQIWFEIEAHACDAQAALGVIPESAAKNIRKRSKWSIARIDRIEKETRHDVEPAAAQRRHFDQLTAQELYSTHDSDIRPDSLSGDAP